MSDLQTCERCRAKAKGYDLHDYCARCSKNLCEDCMAKGCCRLTPAESGIAMDNACMDAAAKKQAAKR